MPGGDDAPALWGDELGRLLDSLAARRLKIGSRERILASTLVSELVARGAVRAFADLKPALSPLLARNIEEQHQFSQAFDELTQPRPAPAPPTPPMPPRPDLPETPGKPALWPWLVASCVVIIGTFLVILWWQGQNDRVAPEAVRTETPTPAEPAASPSAGTQGSTPSAHARTDIESLNRIRAAAAKYDDAPTIIELARELASNSPIGWDARGYAVRLNELSGLPKNWPLALYGVQKQSGDVWARLALALERIEKPGRENTYARLLAAANDTFSERGARRDATHEIAARLPNWFPGKLRDNDAALVAQAKQRYAAEPGMASPQATASQIARAFAMSDDPRVRRYFKDAPWIEKDMSPRAPWWAAWLAAAIPVLAALYWFWRRMSFRKAYLRQRPPRYQPRFEEVSAPEAMRAVESSNAIQTLGRQLRMRTEAPAQRVDVAASVLATIAGGGELIVPVYETVRHAPDYLVLIERRSAMDQEAQSLRHLIRSLRAYLPSAEIYYYRLEPSYVEPEAGGLSARIDELAARHPDHRVIVLGSGEGFIDPLTQRLTASAAAIKAWARRTMLTPRPLAEWGRTEFAIASQLQMAIGRATPEGLLSLARNLGLEDGETARGLNMSGDGLARPVPAILRVTPQKWLYPAPPDGTPVEEVIRELRNYLDGATFDWLCALAIYPAVQWDLTLYLGLNLPAEPGGDAVTAPMYREDRVAALTRLPWLREGHMPNWLRTGLIAEMEADVAAEARRLLNTLFIERKPAVEAAANDRIRLRIGLEDLGDRFTAEDAARDEVMLDFMARGRLEDFEARWLDRILPKTLSGWFGVPEAAILGLTALYAATAFWVTPGPGDGALLNGAWLPMILLAVGAVLISGLAVWPRASRFVSGFFSSPMALALRGFAAVTPAVLAIALAIVVARSSIRLPDIPGGITAMSESADGRWLALGGGDGKVRIFSTDSLDSGPISTPTIEGQIARVDFKSLSELGQNSRPALEVMSSSGVLNTFLSERDWSGSPVSSSFINQFNALIIGMAKTDETFVYAYERVYDGSSGVSYNTAANFEINASGMVTALLILPQRRVAVATLDGRVRIVEFPENTAPRFVEDSDIRLPGRARELKLNADGTITAIGDDGTVIRALTKRNPLIDSLVLETRVEPALKLGPAVPWDGITVEPGPILRHTSDVNDASFSPDGKSIVTASDDNTAKLWDAQTGTERATLKGHGGTVRSAQFSPDGKSIVTASDDNTAKVWDAQTGTERAILRGHSDSVQSAQFSPDGKSIVTASLDATAKIWDAQTGRMRATLNGHDELVWSAQFSPSGEAIVTASSDGTAKIWDAQTGTERAILRGHSDSVQSAQFSPDGKSIVTASFDATAKIWDAQTGRMRATLKGHGGTVWSAQFSPDSKSVVTASLDDTAKIWDAQTGTERAILRGHSDSVQSAQFSPNGRTIVTASTDNTAKIWDAQTGTERATLTGHSDWVRSAQFSPDGTRIVTASRDITARIWNLDGANRATVPRELTQVELAAKAAVEGRPVSERAFRECDNCPEMVVIPPGKFMMGSPATEPRRLPDEGPQREVTLAQPFAVSKFEVTFDDWNACVSDGGCQSNRSPSDLGWGRGNRPVINVSWSDAQGYVRWLSAKTGKTYRLLSEAEWEYAARAGSSGAYPFGGGIDRVCAFANVMTNKGKVKYPNLEGTPPGCEDDFIESAPVGSFTPNAFGLFDTVGNVWEWVEDCHGPYAAAPTNGSAAQSSACANRVLRGGSWNNTWRGIRSAYRNRVDPGMRKFDIGFRVARTIDEGWGGGGLN